MSWIAIALIGLVLNSLSDIFKKINLSGKNKLPYMEASFLTAVVISICLGLYAIFINFEMPPVKSLLLLIPLNIILGVIGWITSFRGMKGLEVGDYYIVMSSRVVVTLFASMVLLGVGLNWQELAGVFLIVSAVLIIFFKKGSISHAKRDGLLFTALTAVNYGFSILIDQQIYRVSNPSSYLLIGFVLSSLTFIAIRPSLLSSLPILADKKKGLPLWLSGSFLSMGLIFIFTSLKMADNAPLVSGFFQLQIVIGVLLGIIFLKERDNLKRKMIGLFVAFLGALMVSV